MAVEIDLHIYQDSSERKSYGSIQLYFGRVFRTTDFSKWGWVKENGMTIELPNVLDDSDTKRGKIVTRETLLRWIQEGFLSLDSHGRETSGSFLNFYPKNAVFRLSFLDWS